MFLIQQYLLSHFRRGIPHCTCWHKAYLAQHWPSRLYCSEADTLTKSTSRADLLPSFCNRCSLCTKLSIHFTTRRSSAYALALFASIGCLSTGKCRLLCSHSFSSTSFALFHHGCRLTPPARRASLPPKSHLSFVGVFFY